ncbi:NirD/YgiW/YdeI family stress tolerance protein [Neisseriaceae bacterium PsAf]|nr:NirD/YgiW/YdeI family stress tolerance protein [Neisseriaceae bacterium PsAf]
MALPFAVAANPQPLNQTTTNTYQQGQPLNRPALTTVANAKTLKDDTKIVLEGVLLKAYGDEKYQFKDNTGSIIVEIDDKLWKGKPVYPNQKIRIRGEVEKKIGRATEIDADEVEFLQ